MMRRISAIVIGLVALSTLWLKSRTIAIEDGAGAEPEWRPPAPDGPRASLSTIVKESIGAQKLEEVSGPAAAVLARDIVGYFYRPLGRIYDKGPASNETDPRKASQFAETSFSVLEWGTTLLSVDIARELGSGGFLVTAPLGDTSKTFSKSLPVNVFLLAKLSTHKARSFTATLNFADVILLLELPNIIAELQWGNDVVEEVLCHTLGMGRLIYVVLPCSHSASSLQRLLVSCVSRFRTIGTKYLEYILRELPIMQSVHCGAACACTQPVIQVTPLRVLRGTRQTYCVHELHTFRGKLLYDHKLKYDFLYIAPQENTKATASVSMKGGEFVGSILQSTMAQYAVGLLVTRERLSGQTPKRSGGSPFEEELAAGATAVFRVDKNLTSHWIPSFKLKDVLAWGMGRAVRTAIFAQQLSIPQFPDFGAHNWVVCCGGKALRIDFEDRIGDKTRPPKEYIQRMQGEVCLPREDFSGIPAGAARCPQCRECVHAPFNWLKTVSPPAACRVCHTCWKEFLLESGAQDTAGEDDSCNVPSPSAEYVLEGEHPCYPY